MSTHIAVNERIFRKSQTDYRIGAYRDAYMALPTDKQHEIDGLCQLICQKVPTMGEMGAFELLGALGMYLFQNER